MLWINGHTGWLGRLLGIMPPNGRDYWSNNLFCAKSVTGIDAEDIFINANDFFFSSSTRRYNIGYDYARTHFNLIFEHYLKSGHTLKVIAHSQGVAFAEGLAAYLYTEKGLKIDEAYYLQGNGLGTIPQVKEAVKLRIVFKTYNDKIANKWNEDMMFADIVITENGLKTGFCKYTYLINLPNGRAFSALFIQKGKLIFLREHTAHRLRQNQVWSAIKHGKKVYKELTRSMIKLQPDKTSPIEGIYHFNYN